MGQYRERQHGNTLESGKWRSGGGSATGSLLGRKKVSTVFLDVVVYSVGVVFFHLRRRLSPISVG